MASKPIRLGILVPSSNTALEPLTQALIASLPHNSTTNSTTTTTAAATALAQPPVTAHFSRLAVTDISLTPTALDQFAPTHVVAAARLLAHAGVDVIGWSGTSGGWLGFEHDAALCDAVTAATGIPCTTSVRALNRALRRFGVRSLALVTPYRDDVQAAIVATYRAAGVEILPRAERHLGLAANSDIGLVGEDVLDGLVQSVVEGGGAQAVTTFCTNWKAAQRVAAWEDRWGLPVFDTVTLVLWDMLSMAGFDVTSVEGWGCLFKQS